MAKTETQEAIEGRTVNDAMKNIHVLLVDDDPLSLETLGMILEMDGFRVTALKNGREALNHLERAGSGIPPVDILVVDLEMDQVTGLELVTEMKKRRWDIPVMVVTGFASKGTLVELLRQGVVDYLNKPIQMEEFRLRIFHIAQGVLKRRKSLDDPMAADLGPAPIPGSQDPTGFAGHAAGTSQSLTTFDASRLGIPNSLRRRSFARAGRNLAIANRRGTGYDMLVAEADTQDLEAFYQTVLIKSLFDRPFPAGRDGSAFMGFLNGSLLKGSLRKNPVSVLFLRIYLPEKRVEIFSAGGIGLTRMRAGKASIPVLVPGMPLGMVEENAIVPQALPIEKGDRFFLYNRALSRACSKGNAKSESERLGPDRLHELFAVFGSSDLETLTESIWQKAQGTNAFGPEDDLLLWGFEIP